MHDFAGGLIIGGVIIGVNRDPAEFLPARSSMP
jgi:hypothetical protein